MQQEEYTIEMQEAFAAKLPLRRLGRPADVAALFAFLVRLGRGGAAGGQDECRRREGQGESRDEGS
jgi:NAD(P)-dependent dehydrogenase (short-subunit alcohol dehydrogenase family)